MTKALKPPLQQNWQKKRLLKNSWLSERNCFEKCKVIMHIFIKSYNGVFLDVENEIENHNKWKKFNHRYKKPGLPSRKIKQVPTIHYITVDS